MRSNAQNPVPAPRRMPLPHPAPAWPFRDRPFPGCWPVALIAAALAGPALAQAPFGGVPPFTPPGLAGGNGTGAALPPGGAAPAAEQPGPPVTSSRGGAVLLEQANYWRSQGRLDLAQGSLDRLLTIEPNNPNVLATAAEVAALNRDRAAVQAYVTRLNAIARGSPAAVRAASALRMASIDEGMLAEARRLAQTGQAAAAIRRYRDIFPDGVVPDAFATEYYQTLSSISPQAFAEARAAMEGVLARNPEDRALQLAFAQMLTFQEPTRPLGIERLRALSELPDTANAARAAWRQALLWQGPGEATIAAIGDYLRHFPTDPEISKKLEDSRPSPTDQIGQLRIRAFDLMKTRPAEAERLFEQALAANPQDVDSTLGLGMLRRAQRREADARRLFERAVELAPDRRDEFLRSMGYVNAQGVAYGAGGNARGTRPVTGPALQAWRALERGQLDEAEELARRMPQGTAAEGAEMAKLLGLIAARRRDYDTAELRFRESLARRPGQRDVQAALHDSLVQRGRFAEADRFAAEAGYSPATNTASFRAGALRAEAARTPDVDASIALYRRALAAEPNNAWTAHDLARLLKTRGEQDEARRIERDLIRRGTPDSLYAAGLLAEYDGRPADAAARAEAIRGRNADANALLARNRRVLEVQRLEVAARGNPRSAAAQRLIAMAAEPDPGGDTRAAVLRVFGRLRQPENLEAATRAANPAAPANSAEAKALMAAALLDAGRATAAENLARRAESDPRLGTAVQRTAAGLPAVSGAGAGAGAAAGGTVPDSWRAQLSLARVLARTDRAREATELAEGVLSRDPRNAEARSVAGEIAVVRGNLSRAEQILADGKAMGGDELQMALLEARIARAREDGPRARRALETAARLRGEQLRGEGR